MKLLGVVYYGVLQHPVILSRVLFSFVGKIQQNFVSTQKTHNLGHTHTQLAEVVAEMSAVEQRYFLLFISGSPRMPLGGLMPKVCFLFF